MGLDIVMMSSPAPPIIVSALLERALPTARAAPHNGPMAVESHLIGMLADVVGSTGHRYDAKDDAGRSMDTLKVIASPAGGYLGVYHTGDIVRLATSSDLLCWNTRSVLDPQATQPTIAGLPTGGFLTAVEYNDQTGSGGLLRFRHYPDLTALLAARHDREQTLPRTLSRCNEGTPSIARVDMPQGIDRSVVQVGFHYHRRCVVDRQAHGTLTDFRGWTTSAATDLDDALIAAAAAGGHPVKGNIGDRDAAVLVDADGRPHEVGLYEVQYRRGDFGSWRVYCRVGTSAPVLLPIRTHGGSTAFANPTLTPVTSAQGKAAVAVTMFLPGEGAAPGEAGELIYFREVS